MGCQKNKKCKTSAGILLIKYLLSGYSDLEPDLYNASQAEIQGMKLIDYPQKVKKVMIGLSENKRW